MRILIFLCCCLLSFPVWAKTDFSAVIPVDVEAQNSVEAKEKGMINAQRDAFLEVAGRLTTAANVEKLKELSDDAILHFIKSVSVADEKAGGTKYIANLTVQINEELLRDYMVENEMIAADTVDLMVIPVLKNEHSYQPLLWEGANIWRQQWISKGLIKFGAMQIHTIGEHFRNIIDLNGDTALYMPDSVYSQISRMNGSDKIYVVAAEIMPNGDLKVTVKNEKNKNEDNFTILNDNSGNIFDKAIEKSVMFISNMERDSRQADNAPPATGLINAAYTYTDMKDWLTRSVAMTNLPMVEGVDVKSFGGGKVSFSIRYTGSLEHLWEALQEIGLSHEMAGNYYIIR